MRSYSIKLKSISRATERRAGRIAANVAKLPELLRKHHITQWRKVIDHGCLLDLRAEPARYCGSVAVIVSAIHITGCVYFKETMIDDIEFVLG